MRTWVWVLRTLSLPLGDLSDAFAYLVNSWSIRPLSQEKVPWGMISGLHIHIHTIQWQEHIHTNTHTLKTELRRAYLWRFHNERNQLRQRQCSLYFAQDALLTKDSRVQHQPGLPFIWPVPTLLEAQHSTLHQITATWPYSHWVSKPLTFSRKYSHSVGQVKSVAFDYNWNCS